MRCALLALAACTHGREAPECPAGTVASGRLQTGRTFQSRCFCRRICRSVAVGAVALHSLRHVAVGSECFFLLDEHAERIFLSGRRMALKALWPRQHDGLYPHPIEHLSDRRSILTVFAPGSRVATGEGCAFANGCSNAHILRYGGGDARRAHGCGSHYSRSSPPFYLRPP